MNSFLLTFGFTVLVILTAFALIGIKVLIKPGGEFKKNCGNLKCGDGCSHCGRPTGEVCEDHDSGGCDDHRDGNNESKANT